MVDVGINDVKKQPEKKIRAGPIAIAIWRNTTHDGTRSFYSITFEKRFKDRNKEEWKSTNTLGKNDIPKAMIALQEAYKYLVLHKTPQEIIEEALEEDIVLPNGDGGTGGEGDVQEKERDGKETRDEKAGDKDEEGDADEDGKEDDEDDNEEE